LIQFGGHSHSRYHLDAFGLKTQLCIGYVHQHPVIWSRHSTRTFSLCIGRERILADHADGTRPCSVFLEGEGFEFDPHRLTDSDLADVLTLHIDLRLQWYIPRNQNE